MRLLQHALKRRCEKLTRFCGKLKPPPNITMMIVGAVTGTGMDIIIPITALAIEPILQAISAITWGCIASITTNTDAITNTGTIKNTAVMAANMGTIRSIAGILPSTGTATNTGDITQNISIIPAIDQKDSTTIVTTAPIASEDIIP